MDKTMRDWPALPSQFTLPMRYLLRGPKKLGTVILLHGYQDHAMSMTKRMGWLESELPFQILAINAPFPVPIWKKDGFIEAYSWYFRDTSRDLMIVSPYDTATEVGRVVKQVLGDSEPIVLLGFSQGGYLAPYLAKHLPMTKAIVTVGSGFPPEPYSELKNIRVYGLHGAKDDRWPIESSIEAHKKLMASGFKGEFHIIPDLDHRVDPKLDPFVRKFVAAEFKGES